MQRLWTGLLVALVAVLGNGLLATLSPTDAGASIPTITGLTATPSSPTPIDGSAIISASVSHAQTCVLTSSPPLLAGKGDFYCHGVFSRSVNFPDNFSAAVEKYKITVTAYGRSANDFSSESIKVKVHPGDSGGLANVQSVSSDGPGYPGYCALLATHEVDCWGDGSDGQLGNGRTYSSTIPVQVQGLGGSGDLSDVSSLTSAHGTWCACWLHRVRWTAGAMGPAGPSGTGPKPTRPFPFRSRMSEEWVFCLGSTSLTAASQGSFCATLTLGGVDCWGFGFEGQLGDGSFSDSRGAGTGRWARRSGPSIERFESGERRWRLLCHCHLEHGELLGSWQQRTTR